MSTIKINDIIEYLTKNGLTPEDIENNEHVWEIYAGMRAENSKK